MIEMIHASFSAMVKSLRKQRKLTQQELAEQLGVHRNTIGIWERGEYLPESQAIVLELARILQLDAHETQLLEASLTAPAHYWWVSYQLSPCLTAHDPLLDELQQGEMTQTAFSDMVKSLRKQRKLTQQELAEQLGVHRNTIGVWERGDYLPESQTIVLELARVLKLTAHETQCLLAHIKLR